MIYFAQVNLFLLLLYGCYWLLLRRHTFFVWNRAYLLGSLLLAFALPLVPYLDFAPEIALPTLPVAYELTPAAEAVGTTEFAGAVTTVEAADASVASAPVASGWGWAEWLMAVYVLGVLFMAGRLVWQLRRLRSFIHKTEGLDMGSYRLYLSGDESTSPGEASPGSFSFLRHIVITRRDYEENFDTILSHELAHVRQRHSWDVLLVEALRPFFWFNPVLVFYKKSLQQVHEYLADREVCAWNARSGETASPDRYAEFMLSYARATPKPVSLTNPFLNTSLLKNRITMLYKNKNSNWSLGKYAAVALIVGFASLLAASCGQDKTTAKEEAVIEESTADNSRVDNATKETINVEGFINGPDKERLPGVSITGDDGKASTTTDEDGKFSLDVPTGTRLKASFPGMREETVDVGTEKEDLFLRINMLLSEKRDKTAASGDNAARVSMEPRTYNGEPVYTVVDTQPKFPGGVQTMYKFINENMKYPESAVRAKVEGKVFLTFLVLTDGTIAQIKVLKGMGFGTDEEATRVVSSMPKWIPGADEGEKVNVKFNLPISFDLPKGARKQVGMAKPTEVRPTVAKSTASSNAQIDSTLGLKYHLPNSGKEFDENFKITLRGRGFTDSNVPLYILNGVPTVTGGQALFDNIPPSDIESIQVLKGGKATEPYGLRGTNDVVIVTTKKGADKAIKIKN